MNRKERDAVFRAIVDPTRRETLGLLRGGRRDRGEFPHQPSGDLEAPTRAAFCGVVVARRDGTARVCALNANALRAVTDWLRDYDAFWDENLRSRKRYVAEGRR